MKKFGLLFASALALVALYSCSDDEEENYPGREERQEEETYAAQATVTSSDANFTATNDGGTINFKTDGGTVTLNVSCGCEWLAVNSATDLFATSLTGTTLTVTAEQNTVEEDLTGTITLMTTNKRIPFSTITVNQTAYGAPEITVETNEWHTPAVGALTTEISVEASADWTAEAADEWLTVTKTNSGITLTADENEDTEERDTKVTLTCNDGIRTAYDYITVNQDGKAYMTLSDKSITFLGDASSTFVSVETNFDWDCSYDTTNGWFTVSKDSEGLTVTVVANTGDTRNGTVTVTAGDGVENVAETQLTIAQAGINDMILTYTITAANTSTNLPLSGIVNCTVNWGDGSEVQTITSKEPSHTYAEAGEYDIIVSGTVTALSSYNISTETNPLPITAVRQWGLTGLTTMQYALYHCTDLNALPEYTGDAFAKVTSFSYGFSYSGITEIPEGIFDNCPNVTSFRSVFSHCYAVKSVPAGLFDGCPKVTDCQWAFGECSSLKKIPEGLFANNTKVTTFYCVFYRCSSLEEVPSKVFSNCTEATDFGWCFGYCSSIKKIPEGLFADCTKATTFYQAFRQCFDLEELPSKLFGSLEETKFDSSFYGCSSLKTIAADVFNCPKATNMMCTFWGCSALEEIPAGLFDNCPEVTTFSNTFYSCTSLKTIPENLFANCLKVEDFGELFDSCTSLTAVPDGLFANCPETTSFGGTFYKCRSLKAIPANLFTNCPKAVDFAYLFYDCTQITEIPAGLFDGCPELTRADAIFADTSVSYIPTGLFDKNTKATHFNDAFYGCTNIKEIPEGLFANCPEVTRFERVFNRCTGITAIPENLFANCTEATHFEAAFYNIPITEIPANLFANNKKATNFTSTFSACSKITGGESPYDVIDGVPVHLYERENYPDVYTEPTSHNYCFADCTGLSDYDSIPSGWGGGASANSISSESIPVREKRSMEPIYPQEIIAL